MKKWTFRILICLILGVVTTVGVAWGRAASFDWLKSAKTSIHGRDVADVLCVDVFHSWAIGLETLDCYISARNAVDVGRSVGDTIPGWCRGRVDQFIRDEASRRSGAVMISFRAYGWPLPALHSEHRNSPRVHNGGILMSSAADPLVGPALPLRPYPLGVAINTLFYAAIWFGLFFAMGRTRRFIRTRRGRCPRCGYDLRKNLADGCSECGWGRGE